MKKIFSICAVALLVASSASLITSAATTKGGRYIYSTGSVNKSNGNSYGFIGNKNNATSGIKSNDAEIIDSNGYQLSYDSGSWWSEVSATVRPGAAGSYVENDALEYYGRWSHFRYN
ncbi:MAG: hypothetical protein ACRC68_03075 [Clostridium sp.]